MTDLNNIEEIKKLDPKNVYASTGMFTSQCRQIVNNYYGKEFYPADYKQIKNIVICGMGGSAYGAHVAITLFAKEVKVPIILVSDYHLPGFVGQDTLVLLTSYSGTTEEVLSCAREAEERGAKITGFCSGGALGDFLKEKYPGFIFNPENNPSGQPRLGTGYIIIGTFVLLNALGVISISKEEIMHAIDEVENSHEETKKTAMTLSQKILGFVPAIFASEHLVGNAHIMRNQFNETSKSFSAFEDIPELNHHLMEGLKNPSDKKIKALFITSDLYSDKHKKRISLTEDVVSQNGVKYLEYAAGGRNKLSQVLNVLSFGGYITLYLALLYGQDPSLIPWVDYFKEKLAK